MLDRAREDARAGRQRRRQDVDRLRRVANEDDRVTGTTADEARDGDARILERRGRDLRLQAAAAVHAAVPGNERLDGFPHGGHHRSAGRVVEVHVALRRTVATRHERVRADETRQRLVCVARLSRHVSGTGEGCVHDLTTPARRGIPRASVRARPHALREARSGGIPRASVPLRELL
jgi:hypothetical protein